MILGFSTGAADIFGVTGGVMEAALRTVYEIITGRELPFPNLHVSHCGLGGDSGGDHQAGKCEARMACRRGI